MRRIMATITNYDYERLVCWLPGPWSLLMAGIVLRVSGLLSSSIWYDEAFSLELARLPLLNMVQLASQDFNPPLWELLIWPVVRLVGFNSLGLRLLALAAGIAALVLTYHLIDRGTYSNQLYTMALAALLPGLLWICQDGRIYAVFSLLYLAGFIYARRGSWLGLLAVCGLLLYCHGTGAFYVLALLLIAWVSNPQSIRKVILVGLGALVAWLPWLPSALSAANDSFWLSYTWQYFGIQSVGALFGPTLSMSWSLLAAILLAFSVMACTMIWLERFVDRKNFIASDPTTAMAVLVPVVSMVIVSITYKPIIFYRPLAPVILPLCLWIGESIAPRRLTWTSWIIPYTWSILLVVGLISWTPSIRGGNIEAAANLINLGYKSGEVVYHATGTSYLPLKEYLSPEIPQEIMPLPQAAALLRPELATAFGGQYADLADDQPAWIVFAKDPVLDQAGQKYMFDLLPGSHLVTVIHGWQFAPIEFWHREGKE